jgi:hypothetical protein
MTNNLNNPSNEHIFTILRDLWIAAGFKQSVIEQELLAHSRQFERNSYGEWALPATAENAYKYTERMKEEKKHWQAGYIEPELTQTEEARQIIRAVSENPTTKTLHALFAFYKNEPGEAEQVLKAAGIDLNKPGKGGKWEATRKLDLTGEDTITATPKEQSADAKSKNPWSNHYIGPKGIRGPNATAQGQLIKAIGLEKSAAIARAAKSFIGATRGFD